MFGVTAIITIIKIVVLTQGLSKNNLKFSQAFLKANAIVKKPPNSSAVGLMLDGVSGDLWALPDNHNLEKVDQTL